MGARVILASMIVDRKCASRWFVRCRDCLSVVAVEVQPTAEMRCGACDGKIEVMGRVTRDGKRMVTGAYDAPACDARCTHARGPSCDCQCGGVNHGTGATVPVVEMEGAPRVMVPAAARRIADEWRAELARVADTRPGRLASLPGWLPDDEWYVADQYRRLRSHARTLRTHRGRMACLARIVESGILSEAPVKAPIQGSLL